MSIVCKFCGVRQDAVAEPRACSGRDSASGHEWNDAPVSSKSYGDTETTLRLSVGIFVALLGVGSVAAVLYIYRIQILGVAIGLVDSILSLQSWVWICIAILYAAHRIVKAIDRHAEKEKAQK